MDEEKTKCILLMTLLINCLVIWNINVCLNYAVIVFLMLTTNNKRDGVFCFYFLQNFVFIQFLIFFYPFLSFFPFAPNWKISRATTVPNSFFIPGTFSML